jgi:hypothetical protein
MSPAGSSLASTSPAQRSTGTAASSDSSSVAPTLLHALEPEDVVIEILADGATRLSRSKLSFPAFGAAAHVLTERSYFVIPRDTKGRPTRKLVHDMKIVVGDVQIQCVVHPHEVLLYTRTLLNSNQVKAATDWLVQNYSLDRLQRASAHVVQEIDSSQTQDDRHAILEDALKQRAMIVAEATAQRAALEAATEDSSRSPVLKRVVRHVPHNTRKPTEKRHVEPLKHLHHAQLLEERKTIEETIASFKVKIAHFELEDMATAQLLVPAKLDLEEKLRLVNISIEHCKEESSDPTPRTPQTRPETDSLDEARLATSVITVYQHSSAMTDDQGSSSEDDEDFRMALPIDGSEYDVPYIKAISGKTGYSSGQTDSSDDENSIHKNRSLRAIEQTSFGAEYIIDLSSFKTPSSPRYRTGQRNARTMESSNYSSDGNSGFENMTPDVSPDGTIDPIQEPHSEEFSNSPLVSSRSDLESASRWRTRRGGR